MTDGRRHDESHPAWLGLATALLVCRWLVPTESATAGATLWLVVGWLALASLWSLATLRSGGAAALRPDRYDLAVAVLVVPQLLATLRLLATGDGDGRAAVNMAWEWVGLAVAFWLLRRLAATASARAALLRVAIAVAVTTAGLGIWQHHFGYQQLIDRYDQMAKRLSDAERTGDLSALREVQAEMAGQRIPLEGPALILWEARLRDSREPFGLFALANSLAGLLVPLLLVAVAGLLAGRPEGWSSSRYAGVIVLLALTVYCLILTKSRTAWVGFACGGIVLAVANRQRWARRSWVVGLAGLSVVVLLGLAAALGRGLDREVLTEAPKSLRFRLQYWQGTLGVIGERPWRGTGPGNFRQHYLAHKLDGSSEEIADPHNAVLEATATGGLLGLTGLLGCVLLAAWPADQGSLEESSEKANPGGSWPDAVSWGGGGGFLLAASPGLLLFGEVDWPLAGLFAGWVAAIVIMPSRPTDGGRLPAPLRTGVVAGLVALGVHLMGAGGFSMPALVQLALLLLLCLRPIGPPAAGQPSRRTGLLAAGPPLLLIVCLGSALLPHLSRSAQENLATAALIRSGGVVRAVRYFEQAVVGDPLDPEPARQLAELRFRRWEASADDDLVQFELATSSARLAHKRDPHSWSTAQTLGRFHRALFTRRGQRVDADAAVTWMTRARDRYPSSAALRADLAGTLAEAGQPGEAARQAQEALRLQGINLAEGHVDKLLDETRIERLKTLTAGDGRD